ncbi:MAG: hypothetical protein K2J78_11360 [Muribaculaceae bacterium]|nr:hypothetical protein [Muribaculaceae bacterium]MDE6770311.1 hypothetical protein [Muribaculaceae bacterium]
MFNVNYGNTVSDETRTRISKLLEGEDDILYTGISEDVILEMMNLSGEKVLNITTGNTIDEAVRCLPDNGNELISEAAVLIKANTDYHFSVTDLVNLIRYFDTYPMDPKITWSYTVDSDQEDPINIIIFKILHNKQ